MGVVIEAGWVGGSNQARPVASKRSEAKRMEPTQAGPLPSRTSGLRRTMYSVEMHQLMPKANISPPPIWCSCLARRAAFLPLASTSSCWAGIVMAVLVAGGPPETAPAVAVAMPAWIQFGWRLWREYGSVGDRSTITTIAARSQCIWASMMHLHRGRMNHHHHSDRDSIYSGRPAAPNRLSIVGT